MGFARERLAADPSLRSADLAEAIAAHFGVPVHPRSVDRVLRATRAPHPRPVQRALQRADRLEVERRV